MLKQSRSLICRFAILGESINGTVLARTPERTTQVVEALKLCVLVATV